MSRLPEHDRALIVAPPHGDRLAGGQKTALVRARRHYVEGEPLLVVQSGLAIGTVVLSAPRAITLADFRALRARHLVSEDERRRRWPGKTVFYLYDVAEFRPVAPPVPVEYPRGPQAFVRAGALRAA